MNAVRSSVGWGVIGCGQIAVEKSIPGLLAAQSASIVAVSDPLPARQAAALAVITAADTAPPKTYSDYHDLLADPDVDAVYIALPTGMHAQAVADAARAKKAILCEKPLGRSADEVAQMIRAAEAAGVTLMTAYMSRFGDTFVEAAKLLGDGKIGQITFVYANFSYPALEPYPLGTPGAWRWTDEKGGGPLLDIGVYLAFGLREMLHDRVAKISALQCDTVAPPGVPNRDTTTAWFQTEKGIPGVFAATFSHAESRIIFYGIEGKLEIANCFSQRPTGTLEYRGKNFHRVLETGGAGDSLPHYENYRREFVYFSHALLSGTPHRPSVDEVMTDALLLDALNQNAQGVVDIPDARTFLNGEK